MLSTPGQNGAGKGSGLAWTACWAFISPSGVTCGHTGESSYGMAKTELARAAERSLAGLSESEADAMDKLWNRFIARLETAAELQAAVAGHWVYSDSCWASARISCS